MSHTITLNGAQNSTETYRTTFCRHCRSGSLPTTQRSEKCLFSRLYLTLFSLSLYLTESKVSKQTHSHHTTQSDDQQCADELPRDLSRQPATPRRVVCHVAFVCLLQMIGIKKPLFRYAIKKYHIGELFLFPHFSDSFYRNVTENMLTRLPDQIFVTNSRLKVVFVDASHAQLSG
jgi:hypothetical protein